MILRSLVLALTCVIAFGVSPAIDVSEAFQSTDCNVEALHNLNSGTIETYEYDPYGRVRDALDSTGGDFVFSPLANDMFFLSRPHDLRNGIVQLESRVFDTTIGRFVSRDPLGEEASSNLFSYSGQNPMRWIDPTGLSSEDASSPKTSDDGLEILTAGNFSDLMDKFVENVAGNFSSEGLAAFGLEELATADSFASLSAGTQEVVTTLMLEVNQFLQESSGPFGYSLTKLQMTQLGEGSDWGARFLNKQRTDFSFWDGVQIR